MELFTEMKEREAEADALRDELGMSLQIQELWPQAFEHGRVSASLHGPFQSDRLDELQFRIRRGDVDERYFPIAEVPRELRDFHIDRHLEVRHGHMPWSLEDDMRLRNMRDKWDKLILWYYESDGGSFPSGGGGWVHAPKTHYLVLPDPDERRREDFPNKRTAMQTMRKWNEEIRNENDKC